jgi:hypothetical protein
MQVSDVLVLTVICHELFNFAFEVLRFLACWLHVLYSSDHFNLIPLHSETTAIWLVSVCIIILIALRRTVPYASSAHKNLDSLWLK